MSNCQYYLRGKKNRKFIKEIEHNKKNQMETIVLKMQHQNKKCAVDRTIEISQSNSRVNRPQKNQTKHKPKNQLAKPEEPMGEKKLAEP